MILTHSPKMTSSSVEIANHHVPISSTESGRTIDVTPGNIHTLRSHIFVTQFGISTDLSLHFAQLANNPQSDTLNHKLPSSFTE
jgi:hypothetical protein